MHPPYWNIVRYTDDPADLSNATSYEDFIRKLYVCMKRCGKALNAGGRLTVLVGDVRKQGRYFPIVREVMNMERDLGDLRSVIIKVQHNCTSDGKNYGRLEDVPIKHEYCIVFKARSVGAGSAHGTAA